MCCYLYMRLAPLEPITHIILEMHCPLLITSVVIVNRNLKEPIKKLWNAQTLANSMCALMSTHTLLLKVVGPIYLKNSHAVFFSTWKTISVIPEFEWNYFHTSNFSTKGLHTILAIELYTTVISCIQPDAVRYTDGFNMITP